MKVLNETLTDFYKSFGASSKPGRARSIEEIERICSLPGGKLRVQHDNEGRAKDIVFLPVYDREPEVHAVIGVKKERPVKFKRHPIAVKVERVLADAATKFSEWTMQISSFGKPVYRPDYQVSVV